MIVTPLDSAVLDSKEQYVFYHKMIDFTLKELITAVQEKRILNDQEIILFKQNYSVTTWCAQADADIKLLPISLMLKFSNTVSGSSN